MTKDRKGIIYAHINKINGHIYIGQTVQTLQERSKKDGQGYKRCTKFYNAIQKYGWNNFEHIILECGLEDEEMNDREKYWISYYDSVNNGYNIDLGGANQHMSDKHKLNIQKSLLKYARKIICVNNGKIYNSIAEAERSTRIEHIWDCCNGKLQSAGADDNGFALVWKYLDEYDQNENFTFKKQYKTNEPVICITTGEIYSCIREASQKLNIDDGSISRCCNGTRLTAGVDKNGQLLAWKYLYDYQLGENNNSNINCKQKHLFIRNLNLSINDYISIHLFALNTLSFTEYKLFTYCMSFDYDDFPLTPKYITSKINVSENACYLAINALINNGFIIKINNYGCYMFNNNVVKDKINSSFRNKKIISYHTYSANSFKINNTNLNLYDDKEKLNTIIRSALSFMPAKSLNFKLFMYILLYFLQDNNYLIINNNYLYNDIKITHDSVLKGLQYLIEIGYLNKEDYGKKVYCLNIDKMIVNFTETQKLDKIRQKEMY